MVWRWWYGIDVSAISIFKSSYVDTVLLQTDLICLLRGYPAKIVAVLSHPRHTLAIPLSLCSHGCQSSSLFSCM